MRISDWSSDVCSSDLIGDARREREPEEVENAENRVGIAGRIGHDFAWPQFGFLVEHDRQQMEAVAQRTGDRHGIQPGKTVGNQIVPGDTAFAPEIRSEEHTSELQSLMRNSYAVFCLKKKKTN